MYVYVFIHVEGIGDWDVYLVSVSKMLNLLLPLDIIITQG